MKVINCYSKEEMILVEKLINELAIVYKQNQFGWTFESIVNNKELIPEPGIFFIKNGLKPSESKLLLDIFFEQFENNKIKETTCFECNVSFHNKEIPAGYLYIVGDNQEIRRLRLLSAINSLKNKNELIELKQTLNRLYGEQQLIVNKCKEIENRISVLTGIRS